MHQLGRHGGAIAAYRKALGLDPRGSCTWVLLGHVLDVQDDGPGVLEAYEQLRALDPPVAKQFHEKHVEGRPWAVS